VIEHIEREQVIEVLRTGWGEYVTRFELLSSAEQQSLLDAQGYERLADLLAHVLAWWEEGTEAITHLLNDPDHSGIIYDVDAFNAGAVERLYGLDESAVIRFFDRMRASLMVFVASLPDAAFDNPKIAERLYVEIIGHLAEHALPVQCNHSLNSSDPATS
jgi:hypothetical protein